VVQLTLNGVQVPATLAANIRYRFGVLVNGAEVIPSSWVVTTGSGAVARGFGSFIEFTPVSPVAHTISAKAVGDFGMFQEAAVTVNVASNTGLAEAGVNWEKLLYASGEALVAKIVARDSKGTPPSRVVWSIYRNGTPVFNGEGTSVSYTGTMPGVYRVKGVAYCVDGSQLSFDSAAFVEGSTVVRHTLPVPDYEGTAVYLGAVYTQNIASVAGTVTSLPYLTASSTEDICLLPGTTHWMFDVDPDTTTVDDEIVLRTKKGNWCLNGLAGGLAGEDVGFDYGYMPTMIPAPTDHRIRLTANFYKVHGLTYAAYNTRVRIKCYRVAPAIYRYERCACGNSAFPGGEGRRTRRWAALFTQMDVQTDVFTRLNRMGTGNSVITYSTVNTTSVPLMTLSTSGTPNPVPGFSGLYYTDSNLYAYYEADSQPDIAAKAISAIESIRPCCISLLTFLNTKPIVCNRIKRVYGKLCVLLTEGVVFEGSVVTARVWRSDGLQYTDYTVPITETAYANEDSVLLKVGEVDIDLTDYQFDETGIVVDFTVDESAAVTGPIPSPVPTPVVGPDYIYSTNFSHTVNYDGACYTNPTYVSTLDDDAVLVTPVGGCHDPSCGPSALYCYTALDAPAENIIVPQPFGFPAPFVSYGSNPSRCFYNPVAYATLSGTNVSLTEFTGTAPVDLWSFTGTSLCGASYGYNACQSAYAPCTSYACSIVVVYPVSSSPHSTVEYGGRCYTFNGSTSDYGTRPVVAVAAVNPALGCYDPVCNQFNSSGSVVVYNDTQTFLEVPVCFEHLDYGTAHYGAAAQKIDDWVGGLKEGGKSFAFTTHPNLLVYTSEGTGSMMFEFSLTGVPKQILVNHNGAVTTYRPGTGGSRQIVTLQPNDKVYIQISDPYGRLPLQYRGLRVRVRWHPVLSLPRLYDTVVVPYSGSTAINALGFCAYTTQGVYTFYGTLPFTGTMSGPVNPDSLVTVVSGTQEYSLLSVRAVGDTNIHPLGGIPNYAGQALNGPFTFKFYAAREAMGAHGEMDVWFDTNGTFPAYLRAGYYDALMLSGTNYRKDWEPTDTCRNSYAVVAPADVGLLAWPCAYVSGAGQVIIVDTVTSGVIYQGTTFNALGWPVPSYDPGLSYTILSTNAVVNAASWLSDADDPWLTDGGDEWLG
jgi:hypothetical protein